MTKRTRLDAELVRRGLARSRDQAADLIAGGQVLVSGQAAAKAATQVAHDAAITVQRENSGPDYVSRGGYKLAGALAVFGDLEVAGRDCLDAGASTGGFTDCLLQRGAASVVAVDVGHGQLHERLRADPRVTVLERTHIRDVPTELAADRGFDVVVADLSFISLARVAGSLTQLARAGAELVVLVKPQFEAGRQEVGRGRGVVRDPNVWARVILEVITAFSQAGAAMMGVMPSPIRGADGNVEFLVRFRREEEPTTSGAPAGADSTGPAADLAIEAAVAEAEATWSAV